MSLRLAHNLVALAFLLLVPVAVHAGIIFGDIGYDVPGADEGREWITIQNSGPDPVDLAGWRFFEGGVNHKLTPIGTATIPPDGTAIIVSSSDGYLADHPGYAGLMFKSSFSLSNSGETLSLKNASGTVMTSFTYAPKPVVPVPRAPAAKKIISNPVPATTVHATGAPPFPSQTAAAGNTPGGIIPWIGGVAAVIAFGIGAAFMMRPMPGREADDYRITEDKL
jgi:hypothetical protein